MLSKPCIFALTFGISTFASLYMAPIRAQVVDGVDVKKLIDEGRSLNQAGSVESTMLAIGNFELALKLYKKSGNKEEEAKTLNLLALAHNSLGEKQQVLKYYTQALPLTREINNRDLEGIVLHGLGAAYASLGDNPIPSPKI